MEIKRKYLLNYLHQIAIDQLTDEYTSKNYIVSVNEKIGNYTTDLIARKGTEMIVIEVKTGKMSKEKREAMIGLGDSVRRLQNCKFLVVLAAPHKEKKLRLMLLNNY